MQSVNFEVGRMEEIGGCVSVWAVLKVKRWGEGLSGERSFGSNETSCGVLREH